MAEGQPRSAVRTEDQPRKQAPGVSPFRYLHFMLQAGGPALNRLLAFFPCGFIDDLQVFLLGRVGVAHPHVAQVNPVVDQRPDGSRPPEGRSALGLDAALIQVIGHPVGAVAFFDQKMENLPDDDRLILVYDQVSNRLIFLIGAALVHQLVPVRQVTSPVLAVLDHLQVLGAHTDGGFFAFAGCLPEPDVVEQLVHVGVEALLPLAGAPDLDALLNKPLHNERRLILTPAQAVEHENQQDVEFALDGFLLDLHNGIAVACRNFVARDAFFRDFLNDLPVRMCGGVVPAGDTLHGDVVVIHLTNGGNTVEAYHSLHCHHLCLHLEFMSIPSTSGMAFSSPFSEKVSLTLQVGCVGETPAFTRGFGVSVTVVITLFSLSVKLFSGKLSAGFEPERWLLLQKVLTEFTDT